jgi:hypothetical protein
MFPVNRVVALFTPVFAAAATVGSAWLLKHFPGIPVPSSGQLLAVEIAGATTAGAAALKWLHGHQQWEARTQKVIGDVEAAKKEIATVDPSLLASIEGFVKAEVAKAGVDLGESPTIDVSDLPVARSTPSVPLDNSGLATQFPTAVTA